MTETKKTCLVCGRDSMEVPLLVLEYREQKYWICPQDFPIVIHQPERLVGKLPGAEKLEAHEH